MFICQFFNTQPITYSYNVFNLHACHYYWNIKTKTSEYYSFPLKLISQSSQKSTYGNHSRLHDHSCCHIRCRSHIGINSVLSDLIISEQPSVQTRMRMRWFGKLKTHYFKSVIIKSPPTRFHRINTI